MVSDRRISFLPDKTEGNAKDGFELALDQSSYSLSNDEFTVKTGTRTYRFKARAPTGTGNGQPSLKDLEARLARASQATPLE